MTSLLSFDFDLLMRDAIPLFTVGIILLIALMVVREVVMYLGEKPQAFGRTLNIAIAPLLILMLATITAIVIDRAP